MYHCLTFYNEDAKAKAFYNDLKLKGYDACLNFMGVKYGQTIICVEYWG